MADTSTTVRPGDVAAVTSRVQMFAAHRRLDHLLACLRIAESCKDGGCASCRHDAAVYRAAIQLQLECAEKTDPRRVDGREESRRRDGGNGVLK
jgi:hypothetical protein